MRRPGWSDAVAAAGFRSRDGGRTWRRRGFVLHPEGRWARIRSTVRCAGDPLAVPPEASLGPGPWKRLGPRAVFDLPPCALEPDRVEAAVAWALATADGAPPAGWLAPAPEDVASWIPAERLSVRAGAFAARGRVVCAPGRLALEIALGSGPAPADSNRAAWLLALLLDAQERWRLVRFALPTDAPSGGGDPAGDAGPPRAEVDLTGAPPALLEPLAQVAADALVEVARGLLAPIALLLDEGASSRALTQLSPSQP